MENFPPIFPLLFLSLSPNVVNGVFGELENLYYNIIMFCVCICVYDDGGVFPLFSLLFSCYFHSPILYTPVLKLSVFYTVCVCVFFFVILCFFLLFVLRLFKMADIVKVNDPNCTFSFIIIVNNFGLMINWG